MPTRMQVLHVCKSLLFNLLSANAGNNCINAEKITENSETRIDKIW